MIAASIDNSPMTSGTKAKQKNRVHARVRGYFYGHKEICLETFLFLMNISRSKLNNLRKHYREEGLVPRRKKSGYNFIFFKLICIVLIYKSF